MGIVQFSYNINFMFWTDSNEESKKDKINVSELQRLDYGSDIPWCMSVIPFLSITQSNTVVWRATTKMFSVFLESCEGSQSKHHRRMLRNLRKLPLWTWNCHVIRQPVCLCEGEDTLGLLALCGNNENGCDCCMLPSELRKFFLDLFIVASGHLSSKNASSALTMLCCLNV